MFCFLSPLEFLFYFIFFLFNFTILYWFCHIWFQVLHSNLETKSKVDYTFDLVFVYGVRWASLVAHW